MFSSSIVLGSVKSGDPGVDWCLAGGEDLAVLVPCRGVSVEEAEEELLFVRLLAGEGSFSEACLILSTKQLSKMFSISRNSEGKGVPGAYCVLTLMFARWYDRPSMS